jgi:transposase
MAPTMKLIAKTCFTKAIQVIDRLHVQKLAMEALQEIRIKYRWQAIDQENEAILLARIKGKEYTSELLLTGDTRKQLLARSRCLLYKGHDKWTIKQQLRAQILFKEYPKSNKPINYQKSFARFSIQKQGKVLH